MAGRLIAVVRESEPEVCGDVPRCQSRFRGGGELTVGLDVHVAVFVRSRSIRHFVPTTGGPAPQEPHQDADRRHPGGDHRRPHQYLSQPEAALDFYNPPLRMPKSGQLFHALRNAHDQLDETGDMARMRVQAIQLPIAPGQRPARAASWYAVLPNPIRWKSRTRETVGNISPQPQQFQNWFGFAEDGGPKLVDISAEDISRHVLLTQLGRKVADIVRSESAVARRTDLPANHEVNVLTRAQAIPIIAHYLRTQQIYLMHPIYNKLAANRQVWYHSAVYAMAPRISYWDLLLAPKAMSFRSVGSRRFSDGRASRGPYR